MIMEKVSRVKSIDDGNYYIESYMVKSFVNTEDMGMISTFGIVTKLIDVHGNTIDFQQVLDISTSKEEVERLLVRVSRNNVTPCTLRDVIEDYIAEI